MGDEVKKGPGRPAKATDKPVDKPVPLDLNDFPFSTYNVEQLELFLTNLKEHLKNRTATEARDWAADIEVQRLAKGLPKYIVKIKLPRLIVPIYTVESSTAKWDGKYPHYTPAAILKAALANTLLDAKTGNKVKLASNHFRLNAKISDKLKAKYMKIELGEEYKEESEE